VKCAIAALVPLKADPEDIPLNIVFEDDYVIVVNKPADMVFLYEICPAASNSQKPGPPYM
jgi:23S rRNA-/tRNA-specific pseudouridylate synthase